jgi:chromosome segregation ATPase
MTILQNVDLEKGTVEVTEYSATNAALAMLREKYATVPDANTDEGYVFIKDGIKELTTLRTSLEAARQREKAPYLQAGKIIDAEAKRITEELVKLESPMKAAKKEVDDRLERERQERIARLQQKVDAIKAMPAQVRGKSSEEISAMLDRVGEIDASHDFYDLTKEAVDARQAALDELTQMLTDRLAFEQAERQRIELEAQQAEMKRQMEAQQVEMRRQQEEMQRQQEEMQRQREEMERQQQELAAAHQQLAERATPATVESEAPKVETAPAPIQIKPAAKAADPTDTPWRARVTDKSALIAAIAAGYATEDLLIIDQPALDSLANDKRQALQLPGVTAEPVPAKAA